MTPYTATAFQEEVTRAAASVRKISPRSGLHRLRIAPRRRAVDRDRHTRDLPSSAEPPGWPQKWHPESPMHRSMHARQNVPVLLVMCMRVDIAQLPSLSNEPPGIV